MPGASATRAVTDARGLRHAVLHHAVAADAAVLDQVVAELHAVLDQAGRRRR